MQKKKKIIIIFLVLSLSLTLCIYIFKPKSNKLVLYGNIDQRQVELAFIDSERVAEVLVEEGAEVEKGQVLARLETRRLRDKTSIVEAQVETAKAALSRLKNGTRPEEIDQARAAVSSAKAELDFAKVQYNRFNSIWKKSAGNAISKQDVDEAFQQLKVSQSKLLLEQKGLQLAEIGPREEDIIEAEAVLLEYQHRLRELKNQLDDATLKSPVNSTVNRRLMEPGDMANPQRAIFSLVVNSPKWVRAYISELNLGHVHPGMEATIYTDSHPKEGITGTLGFISSVAEFTPKAVETAELRTSLVYEVRIYAEDPQNRLRLGMPATITFPDLPDLPN